MPDMKKFLANLALFSLPFVLFAGVYAVLDPFRVIWHYDCFYDTAAPGRVGLNKDYVSTATFDHYVKELGYNSFIFGNSRSMFYPVQEWRKHLGPGAVPFHFDASGESLYGIARKLDYLEKHDTRLDNALLVLDHEVLAQQEHHDGHLFITPPQQVGYHNALTFQWTFFKAFLQRRFLFAYLDFKLSGRMKPYMTGNHLLENDPYRYDPETNEVSDFYEADIKARRFYTPTKMKVFYPRDAALKYAPAALKNAQKTLLKDMAAVFARHNTKLKIVVSPLYDQLKLNPADLDYLKQLFGEGNIFDFSGKNAFTADYKNYFESSHYRPHVAVRILEITYQ